MSLLNKPIFNNSIITHFDNSVAINVGERNRQIYEDNIGYTPQKSVYELMREAERERQENLNNHMRHLSSTPEPEVKSMTEILRDIDRDREERLKSHLGHLLTPEPEQKSFTEMMRDIEREREERWESTKRSLGLYDLD